MHAATPDAGASAAEIRPPDATRFDLGDIYDIVIARRRLLAPALAFCFAIAFGYILLTPARYEANLSILIDPRERVPVGLDLQPMPSSPDPALVESRMRELTSRAVLRRVIESEKLASDSDARPGVLGSTLEFLGTLLRGRPLSAEERTDRAVEALAREISTKRSERSYVVDVDVKARTPEKAVQLGQALVAAYFADQAALSDAVLDKQTAWLDGRIDTMRARVEAAERKVQDYRDREGIAETDGHSSPEQQLNEANAALVAAQGRRAEVEARLAALKAAMTHGATAESINDAIHSATIEKLRQDYAVGAREQADLRTALGPRHPSYIAAEARLVSTRAQIAEELKRIALATERELQAARAAEQSASALVAKLVSSTNEVGDRRVELTDLEREAATLRATYEKLVTARENARRDIVDSPLSLLVDPPAAGTSRASPKILPALLIALAAAINIWIAAALVTDFRERSRPKPIREAAAEEKPSPGPAPTEAPKPAERDWVIARLPPLDPAPRAPGRTRAPSNPAERIAAAMATDGAFAQAVRAILAKLRDHFGDSDATTRLAIASVRPAAGASTLTIALAHAACDEGLRVLIVDCHGENSPLRSDDSRLRFDEHGGGEISVLHYPESRRFADEPQDEEEFDLVLLDCGSLATAGYVINRREAAEAVLAVDIDDSAPGKLGEAIEAAELAGCCVGVALTPRRAEAWKMAS